MRTIKFRGLDPKKNEFVFGQLAYFFNNLESPCIMPSNYFATRDFGEEDEKGNTVIEEESALGGFVNVLSGTEGQFTGKNDKNGKEIYDGDVVKILYTDWPSPSSDDTRTLEEYKNDISKTGKIIFDEDVLGWKVSIYSNKFNEWMSNRITPGRHGFIEVIGNLHQNPELLKP